MKAKLLYVSIPAFANMVREGGGFFRVTKGIAADAKIVRFGYSPERDAMFVVVESDEYPDVAECGELPADYVTVEYEERGQSPDDFISSETKQALRGAGRAFRERHIELTNTKLFGNSKNAT